MGSQAALAQADDAADAAKPIRCAARNCSIPATAAMGSTNYRNAYPDYSVPKLRHQQAAYIIAALNEYKSGQRPHPTMHAQASSLSDQDIEDIAAYLQGRSGEAFHRRQGIGAQASGGLRGMPRREWTRVCRRRSIPSRRSSPVSTSTISSRRSRPITTGGARMS